MDVVFLKNATPSEVRLQTQAMLRCGSQKRRFYRRLQYQPAGLHSIRNLPGDGTDHREVSFP